MQNPQFHILSQGLKALTIIELDDLMRQIVIARKEKMPTVLPQAESELLQKINLPLPKTIQKRYNALFKKRQAETISETEYAELLQLTAYNEAYMAERFGYLLELAKLRHVGLEEILAALEIKPRFYVA